MREQKRTGALRVERSRQIVLGTAGGGLLLLALAWTMFSTNYLQPARALSEGKPGSFTLDRCVDRKGGTYCRGTFRSDDGRLAREEMPLPNKHDAEGLEAGESFPARLLEEAGSDEFARADGTGRGNIREKGVSAAGLGVTGLAVVGFAVRRAVARRDSRAWKVAGGLLGLTAFAGASVYTMWSIMGGGLWA